MLVPFVRSFCIASSNCSDSRAYVKGIESLPITNADLVVEERFDNLQGAMTCQQGRQTIDLYFQEC